jgi:A/G-specific adenine glycosylase
MAGSTKTDVGKVQQKVLRWFDEHARPFPWRAHRDPYATMVAEVMLQQTQTGRVAPTYETFLTQFPTVSRLAHAPSMDVIRAWAGLGYNKRAVNLQRSAQVIEHDLGGEFPSDPAALRTLPGLGEYSANAIACFAFDAQVTVIDVNVSRVTARAVLGVEPEKAGPAKVAKVAEAWLPAGEAYRWNQALMDIGAVVCRIDKPLCAKCPLKAACAFHVKGLDRKPRAPAAAKGVPFNGSRRQKRGGIVDHLRKAASKGVPLGELATAVHPDGEDRDLYWLVDLLEGLERDGLVQLTDAARRGRARGVVRLPR